MTRGNQCLAIDKEIPNIMQAPDNRVEALWAKTCEVAIPPTCPTCVLGIGRTNDDLSDLDSIVTCTEGHTFQLLDKYVIWSMVFAAAGRVMMQAAEDMPPEPGQPWLDRELWDAAYAISDLDFWRVGIYDWDCREPT